MSERKLNTHPAEIDSALRKMNLVLSVSGEGMERVNVLVNALAYVTASYQLEMASVIHALTDSYLSRPEFIHGDDEEMDDD
jgi:hypothetical protein